MEVDVDIATWSLTKTKGPKPSSINYNLINNKSRRLKTPQHQLQFHQPLTIGLELYNIN
jgi:hypothetical protein